MKKRALAFFAMAALLSLGAVCTPAWADNSARIVRLSLVDGNVVIDRADGQGEVHALVNMPVVQGAKIRTGNDGYAELEFERGSTVRLAPNSSLHVDQLARTEEGREVTALSVRDGLVYFDLQKNEADTFHVSAGGQEITASKRAHFRVDSTDSSGEIAVFDGSIRVASGSEQADVSKGHTLRFDANQGARYEVAKNITRDATDGWDSERSGYRDTYAYRSTPYNGYSSSYVYGLSDLNYWGNYYYASGWGWVWRPFDTGLGWTPFSSGAWMFYPSWGWTWVSTYPWGWMPYRYGNWVMVPSYGWCWQPANTWANWHPIPPVRAGAGDGSAIASVRPVPPSRPPLAGAPGVVLVNQRTPWVDRSPGGRPTIGMEKGRAFGPSTGMRIAPGSTGSTPGSTTPGATPRPGTSVGGASQASRPSAGASRGGSMTPSRRPMPRMDNPRPAPQQRQWSAPSQRQWSAPPAMHSQPSMGTSRPSSGGSRPTPK